MSKENKVITNTNIPVTFQKINQFDDRFVQVKIFLMHLGLNYNGSIFTKESVETALPSLKNTPILGYVREDAIGQNDYAGHEMELVVEDGEYKFKYLGSAFGVIPETNNARWEKKVGDDGQEREYLVVDGLMWSKFDDAVGIIERDEIKGQSMELHNDYDGYFDQEGNFVFEKFSFYGACVLGDGVQPAMQRATVEKMFSADQLNSEVNSMMEQFKLNYGNLENKGLKEGYTMDLEKILAKFGVTAEQVAEKGIKVEEFSTEDELEAKISEAFSDEGETPEGNEGEGENPEPETNHEADKPEGDEEGSTEPESDPEGEFQADEGKDNPEGENTPEGEFQASEDKPEEGKVYHKFALAHDDIRNVLWEKISDYAEANGLGERWDFWLHKVYNDHFIMQNEMNGKLYKVGYSSENDNISLGENVEVFAQYLTAEEKGALELMRSNYETLEGEVTQLKEFKATIEQSEHVSKAEALIEQFGLEEDEVKEIVKNVHNYSIEDLEKELFALVGRKNFSIQSPEPKNKVAISNEGNRVSDKPYMKYFAKHGLV
jgi:hypothetical protein